MIIPSVIDEVPKTARVSLERLDTVAVESSVVRELLKFGARFKPNACRHHALHRLGLGRDSAAAIALCLP
jgi:hypothetical protein